MRLLIALEISIGKRGTKKLIHSIFYRKYLIL